MMILQMDPATGILIALVSVLIAVLIALLIVVLLGKKSPIKNNDDIINSKLKEINDNLFKQTKEQAETVHNLEKLVYDNLQKNSENVSEKLNDMNKQFIDNMLKTNQEVGVKMESLSVQLGKMGQAQNQLANLQTDITNLQKVLSGNQTRGKFGERTLHLILSNVFGETKLYSEQYTLKSGERPDAVVFCPEPYNIICIDSKFPFSKYEKLINNEQNENIGDLQNEFNRDVKKHINEIAVKYISNVNTAPFAFMFIPNDAIYIYLTNYMEGTIKYAEQKKVILTSPSTLYPFLSTIYALNIDYKRNKDLTNVLDSIKKVIDEVNKLDDAWKDYLKTYQTLNNKAEEMTKRFNITKKAMDKIDDIKIENDEVSVN
ncbi:MAG: DNA recombination protein RmuC [Erysipelotrichales bacterium]|nr:DNA recombination protein RmuC [Erysipelotrichales bacterium]